MKAPIEWLLTAADRTLQCVRVSDRSGSQVIIASPGPARWRGVKLADTGK